MSQALAVFLYLVDITWVTSAVLLFQTDTEKSLNHWKVTCPSEQHNKKMTCSRLVTGSSRRGRRESHWGRNRRRESWWLEAICENATAKNNENIDVTHDGRMARKFKRLKLRLVGTLIQKSDHLKDFDYIKVFVSARHLSVIWSEFGVAFFLSSF